MVDSDTSYPTSPASVFKAAASFPLLESLTIQQMSSNTLGGYTFSQNYRFPDRLRTVDIDNSEGDFFRAVLLLDPLPVFSSITVHRCWLALDDDSPLGKYIRTVGPGLHHLSFIDCSYSVQEPDLLALRHSTSLRSLYVSAKYSFEGLLSRLLVLLCSFRSPSLTRLTIAYTQNRNKPKRTPHILELWRSVDEILAGETFQSLEMLVMVGWPAQADENVEECLPLSNARGILVFKER
ncbi:hypothetical protein C8R43DRAFT_498906 [Mycena crocata]|nr:hypothetical protein C8R43DRAFT_498906 [Mycena crocata]